MSKDCAIRVEALSKKYRLGEQTKGYKTLRDAITEKFSGLSKLRFRKNGGENRREEFWALRDVSFEVKRGEVVGIIGHNGAGKSTLLKILSRITEPTRGTADIYGRVGSLLEVGTGFHLELTGRENIFLNGAILGMKEHDVSRRFDEIVEFAGVERFVDTPIKHYSSGMHLRLAFAVAAHLEPDILLIDEVLAVGDMAFQKKCLNKMENVATEGRTVLFVSHNMGAIKELCQTALVLKNGKIDFHGKVAQGIQHYTRNVLNIGQNGAAEIGNHGWTRIFINDGAEECRVFNTESFEINSELILRKNLIRGVVHCIMEDAEGNQVVHNYIKLKDIGVESVSSGAHRIVGAMPALYLKPGIYTLYLKLIGETADSEQIKYMSERLMVDVTDKTNIFAGKVYAAILPPVKWDFSNLRSESAAKKVSFNADRHQTIL